MPRKHPTSRFKSTDIFKRRIVITIPRSGAAILAVGIVVAFFTPAMAGKAMAAIAIVVSLVAILTVVEARHQLRNFRYEMQERIAAQIEGILAEIPDNDLREQVEEIFEKAEGVPKDAAHAFLRIPTRPGTSRGNKPA
jgi:hypothetical protein